MNYKAKDIKWILIILFLSVFIPINNIYAADDDSSANFTVSSVPNARQIDTTLNYFYLTAASGDEFTVDVVLYNVSDKPIDIGTRVVDATTSSQGQISYTVGEKYEDNPEEFTTDDLLSKYVFPEEEKITLNPNEERITSFKIIPPKNKYEGIRLGSLYFYEISEESDSQFSVEYGYNLGMIISETGNDYRTGNELLLNKAEAKLVRGARVIEAQLENPQNLILNKMNLKAEIINKKTGEVIKSKEFTDFTMAPTTYSNLDFDFGISQLPSGTFNFKVTASNSIKSWDLEKEFIISEEQANKINSESDFKIVTPEWIKIYSVIMGSIVILDMIYLLVRRNNMAKLFNSIKKKKTKNRKGRK